MKKSLFFLALLFSKTTNHAQTVTSNFNRVSGSVNAFSVLFPHSKVLSFNHFLNTVCFIHRKSPTYVTSPILPINAQSGAIVADIGKNGGTLWDSTLVYANNNYFGRYPQGGIYLPPTAQNLGDITKAYVVAMGSTNDNTNGWVGNFYASKSLTNTVQNNSAGPDQQFMPLTTPFNSSNSPMMVKHDFPRNGFNAPDDGMIYSLSGLYDERGLNSNAPQKICGSMLSKGVFTSGFFVWSPDSFIPPAVVKSNGYRQLSEHFYMAWNKNGTVGYVVLIGTRQGATGNNIGWQPFIYKTTNSGANWTLLSGINFNTMTGIVPNSLDPINTNPSQKVPLFNTIHGLDVSVDVNNDLHIFTTILATKSNHSDSLAFVHNYGIGTDSAFTWKFKPNAWPYLIDFTGNGTSPWNYKIIDSVGVQERVTHIPTTSINFPWYDPDQEGGVHYDTYLRLQMSRSIDGEFILYSWAESDTLMTTNNKKWNEFPNIRTRCQMIQTGIIAPQEYLVSSPPNLINPRVQNKAYFHYMSPVSKYECSNRSAFTFTTPYTVSNNIAKLIIYPVDNFYANGITQFTFPTPWSYPCTTGLSEQKNLTNCNLFPNPATDLLNIDLTLDQTNVVLIELYNIIGQKIAEKNVTGFGGKNNFTIDLKSYVKGVYMVKIKAGHSETIKKLIIE